MLIYSADQTCYLVELSDLKQGNLDRFKSTETNALRQVVDWSRSYLCNPHPDLGRKGPVCPYVQFSMEKNLFFMTIYQGSYLERTAIVNTILKYQQWFLELDPLRGNEAQYKTILILFPNLSSEDAPQFIDSIQAELKPACVANGVIIGEFHAGPPQKTGIRNANFRPFYCPIPVLGIRYMVPYDFPFLQEDKAFVTAYLQQFGNRIPEFLKPMVQQAALKFGIV